MFALSDRSSGHVRKDMIDMARDVHTSHAITYLFISTRSYLFLVFSHHYYHQLRVCPEDANLDLNLETTVYDDSSGHHLHGVLPRY